MSYTIAITGKGGVGKTTLAALLVRRLIESGRRPVLAVDADPNTSLDAALGVRPRHTLGGVREEARQVAGQGLSSGISKQQLLELKISECLVEGKDFDFLAMGRPEGPGCYCYANNVLRATLAEVAGHYPWVVIDNEAGLENLSRRIAPRVDLMIMVADPSSRGLETLRRLYALAREMDVSWGRLVLVVNRVRNGRQPAETEALLAATGADALVAIPDDDGVAEQAECGATVWDLPVTNSLLVLVDRFLPPALPDEEMSNG